MKFYTKLLLVQIALVAVLAGFAYYMWSKTQREVRQVKTEFQANQSQVFNRVFELDRSKLKTFAYDYSWWQDFIDYIEAPDPTWITEQFEQVLYTYDADFMATYDASGRLVESVLDADLQPAAVSLPKQLESTIRNRPAEVQYEPTFTHLDGRLTELYYAPIVPQSDFSRTGPHFGYLVVGRFWMREALDELSDISGFVIREEMQKSATDDWDGEIHFTKALTDLKGDVIATLYISKPLPVADRIINNQEVSIWVLLCTTGFVILVISIFIRQSVSKPLKSISDALESGDTTALEKVSKRQLEFYHLTQLIRKNYRQKVQLEAEIQKRIQIENELKKSRDEAESANRAKARFLTNMSHETRTPLHTISGYASLLRDSLLDAEQEQSVENIQQSCDRLVKMLSDIIDLSSIEADEVSPKLTGVDLQELNYELIAAAESKCFNKPVKIHTELSMDCPPFIVTDYARLRHVLLCIIDNATKFTKEGSITIRTRCDRIGGKLHITYEVEDTGIGIAEEDLGLVFNAFYQADDTEMREHEGGGLGLAVAKGISKLLGAELSVRSKKGAYTIFRLRLVQTEEDLARAEDMLTSGRAISETA